MIYTARKMEAKTFIGRDGTPVTVQKVLFVNKYGIGTIGYVSPKRMEIIPGEMYDCVFDKQSKLLDIEIYEKEVSD